MPAPAELTGRVFGRLTVISRADNTRDGSRRWICRCGCGTLTKPITTRQLSSGHTQSCGCLHRERVGARARTHGLSGTPEHRIWKGIQTRCYNPHRGDEWRNYGGRGIVMSPEWRESFPAFLRDMGPRPGPTYSVERRDNNGPYSRDNCYWATPSEQRRNTRQNRPIGPYRTAIEAAEATGASVKLLRNRVKHGWTDHDALTVPKSTPHIRKRLNLQPR